MNCPSCGLVVSGTDRFCSHCGAELTPQAAADPGASGETPSDAAPSSPPPPTTPPPPPSGYLPPYPGDATPTTPPPPPSGYLPPYPGDATPPPPPPPSGYLPPYPGQAPYGQVPPQWSAGAFMGPVAPFGAPLATWWQRVGAMLLDGIILGIPYFIFRAILDGAFGTNHQSIVDGVTITSKTVPAGVSVFLALAFLVTQAVYFTALNGKGTGQTLGNRAPGIAVRDVDTGGEIGPNRGLLRFGIRFALYIALIVPGLVNDLFPLFSARRQTIADKVARSVVIRVR